MANAKRNMRASAFRRALLMGGALLGAALGAGTAGAQTWTGASSSDFSTATNWNPNTVPNSPATDVVFGAGASTTTVNLDTPYPAGYHTVDGVDFNGSGDAYSINVSNTAYLIVGGNVSNTSGVTQNLSVTGDSNSGAGSFITLNGDAGSNVVYTVNAYGGVQINSTASSASGAGASFVLNGGALDFSGSGTLALGAVSGSGIIDFYGNPHGSAGTIQIGALNTDTTLNGQIQEDPTNMGVLTIEKVGTGNLTLTFASSYTGGTILTSGGLFIGDDNALGTGGLTVASGTTFGGAGGIAHTLANAVTLDAGSESVDTSQGDLTISSGITESGGAATLIKTGTGTLTLTGDNSYTGDTTISGGVLQLGDGNATGSILGNVTDNAALAFDRSDSVTFGGVISGSGAVTQIGAGTTILTGTDTYAGGTTIASGTLQIGAGGTTGSIVGNVTDNATLAFDHSDTETFGGVISGSGVVSQIGAGVTILTGDSSYTGGTTISDGTLQLGNATTTGSIVGNVTDNGVLAIDRSNALTLSGAISGTGSLSQIGAGTTILTGTDTYSGGTTISAGVLQLGAGNATGSIVGNVTDNGTLAFDRSGNATFGGVISGTGAVSQTGPGKTILTGTSTYSGGTIISAGTLQIGNGGTTGSIVGNITDNAALTFDHSDTETFAGVISGSGAVAQIGAGTTILTGTDTYTGGTTISAGTLQIGAGSATGSIVGNVADNGALAFDRSDAIIVGGVISGSGSVRQIGSGVTTLTGANSFTGGLFLNAGVVAVEADSALGFRTGGLTFNGGTLRFDSSFDLVGTRGVTLDAGGGVIDTQGFTTTVSQPIVGVGGLTKTGAGVLVLSSANTYAGGTTISAGTLQIGAGGASGSVVGDIADNGTLTFDHSNTVTFGGNITGSGALIQAGSGALVLDQVYGYTGATTIATGMLVVGDASHDQALLAGGGTVTVAQGAVFGGYGGTAGDVVNNGTLAVADAVPLFAGAAKGAFVIGGALTNNGLVQIAGSGVGNTLEVGSYVGGNGSVVAVNANLGAGVQASDQLAINGGAATGASMIHVTNVGGLGARTSGDGILVVDALNGATTAPTAFHLASTLTSGAYDYALFHGGVGADAGSQDWYLRAAGLSASAQTAAPYAETLGDYADATLGTLQQRTGDRIGEGPAGAWARAGGQYLSRDPRDGAFGGTRYTQGLGFFEAGYDAGVHESGSGVATLGVYATAGASSADLKLTPDPVSGDGRSGKITTSGYGFGLNATWLGRGGFYADSVAQFTWYDSDLSSKSGHNDGWSSVLSEEVGQRLDLGSGWAVAPQGQLAWTHVDFSSFADRAGNAIRLNDGDGLEGRLGARLEKLTVWKGSDGQPQRLQFYGVANLDYQFLNGMKVDVAGAALSQGTERLWGDIGAGADYALGHRWSLFGEASYAAALSGGGSDNYTVRGSAGLKYRW